MAVQFWRQSWLWPEIDNSLVPASLRSTSSEIDKACASWSLKSCNGKTMKTETKWIDKHLIFHVCPIMISESTHGECRVLKTNAGICTIKLCASSPVKILKRKGWIIKWLSVGSLKWNFKMWSYNVIFKRFSKSNC